MDTTTKYNQLISKIEDDLILLSEKLKEHQTLFNNDSSNWGYIGDLEYVSNEIDEVLRFFNK